MDLDIIEQHCAYCGAPVRPGQAECLSCHRPASDPNVRELISRVEVNGEGAIWPLAQGGGCNNIGCAALMLHYLSASQSDLAAAAAAALKAITNREVLREMVVLLGTRRWLGHLEKGKFIEAEHGDISISGVIRSAFSTGGAVHREVLLEQLHNPDFHVREAAADLLQHYTGKDVMDALVTALRTDKEPRVRARAAYAIGKRGDLTYLNELIQAMHDDSPLVLSQAAQALGKIGQGAVPAAAANLASGTPEVALHSARLLGQVGSPEAIHALINTLRSSQSLGRLYAEQALAQMGSNVLVPLLETLIRYSDSIALREGIAYVFRTMRLPEQERRVLQPVIEATERLNASSEVPAAAYQALGVIEGLTPEELRARLEKI